MEIVVKLSRSKDQAWGFRLSGGVDFAFPLTVVRGQWRPPEVVVGLTNTVWHIEDARYRAAAPLVLHIGIRLDGVNARKRFDVEAKHVSVLDSKRRDGMVALGGLADQAGVKAGDVVIKVNGETIQHLRHCEVHERLAKAGNEFTLTVLRNLKFERAVQQE